MDAAVRTCMHIHQNCPPGGVLVFLPGQEDIEAMLALLQENLPEVESYQQRHRQFGGAGAGGGSHSKKRRRQRAGCSGSRASSSSSSDSSGEEEADSPALEAATAAAGGTGGAEESSGPIEVFANKADFELRPLYASMPPDQQLRAFQPCADPAARKFILSTNIAETSVTINDITFVVDTGYYKCKLLDGTTGMETLKTVPVSKQQADQRRGRAGRTGPGQCYRIYTEDVYETHLDTEALPEIQRVSISQVVLQLKTIGVKSPQHFPYVSPPSTDSMRRAMQELLLLGALDGEDASLTPFGSMMSKLPLEPMYACLLLQAAKNGDDSFLGAPAAASGGNSLASKPLYNCVQEMLTTVSMLSSDGVYVQPPTEQEKAAASKKHRGLSVKAGDLPTLLHIYNSWVRARMAKDWAHTNYVSQRALQQAYNVRQQLCEILRKILYKDQRSSLPEREQTFPSCLPEQEPYLKCLAAGLCLNVAQRVESSDLLSNKSGSGSSSSSGSGGRATGRPSASMGEAASLAPYVTLRGRQPVHVHPSSVLFPLTHSFKFAQPGAAGGNGGKKNKLPPFVVFSELLVTTKSYMRGVTTVEGDWLLGVGGAAGAGGLFKKVPAAEKKEEHTTAEAAAAAYRKAQLGKPPKQQQGEPQRMTPQHLAANQGRSGGVSSSAPVSKYVSMAKRQEQEKKAAKKQKKKDKQAAAATTTAAAT